MDEYERQCEKDILDFLLPLDVFLAYAAREVQLFLSYKINCTSKNG